MVLALLLPSAAAVEELRWTPEQKAAIANLTGRVSAIEGGFEVRTKHYHVITHADADFTAKTAVYMEGVRAALDDLLGLAKSRRRAVQVTPKVLVLTDEAAYQTALGSETASRGWFRCHWNAAGRCTEFTLYTFRQRAGPQAPVPFERFYWPILTHEGVHQILQEYAGRNRIPDLLNEGFAAYFQGWNLGRTPAENMQHRTSEYLAQLARPPLTLDEIPRLSEIYDPQPWDVDSFGRRTLVRYAAAESLVEQHLADPAGRTRLRTMLWQALDGTPDHDANRRYLDAIQEGFAQALVERAQRP